MIRGLGRWCIYTVFTPRLVHTAEVIGWRDADARADWSSLLVCSAATISPARRQRTPPSPHRPGFGRLAQWVSQARIDLSIPFQPPSRSKVLLRADATFFNQIFKKLETSKKKIDWQRMIGLLNTTLYCYLRQQTNSLPKSFLPFFHLNWINTVFYFILFNFKISSL